MSKTSDRASGPAANLMGALDPPSPEFFSQLVRPAMSANASMLEMNARLFHVAAEASREWLDFVGQRLEKDAELAAELRHMQKPQDMMDVYARFFQKATQDYQKEFTELMKLSTKAANGASEVIKEAARKDDGAGLT